MTQLVVDTRAAFWPHTDDFSLARIEKASNSSLDLMKTQKSLFTSFKLYMCYGSELQGSLKPCASSYLGLRQSLRSNTNCFSWKLNSHPIQALRFWSGLICATLWSIILKKGMFEFLMGPEQAHSWAVVGFLCDSSSGTQWSPVQCTMYIELTSYVTSTSISNILLQQTSNNTTSW